MKRKITFFVEVEYNINPSFTHNSVGETLRPYIKRAIAEINKELPDLVQRVEVVYLPVMLP